MQPFRERDTQSRADDVAGNIWDGYDWSDACTPAGAGYSCKGKAVSKDAYNRMRAQVHNDAKGWDAPENVGKAMSEPTDHAQIYGNFTKEELPAALATAIARNLDDPDAAIADRLVNAGIEVPSVSPLVEGLSGVVVGEIEAIEKDLGVSPAGHHNHLYRVALPDKRFSVICGAPNAAPGLRTAFAPPGATLPGAGWTV